MTDFPSESLNKTLQMFLRMLLSGDERCTIALVVPTYEVNRLAFQVLEELTSQVPEWVMPKQINRSQSRVDFPRGSWFRILTGADAVRGLSITHVGMYMHPSHPWDKEEMMTVIAALRGQRPNAFFWVTE